MRGHQIGQTGKPKVIVGQFAGISRRAEAGFIVPTVDPAGVETVAVGGFVVVEEAFGGV